MENRLITRKSQRTRRSLKIRHQIIGTAEKPRMSVRKSNRHLAVQVIDDEAGVTLFSASTLSKEMEALNLGKKSKEAAQHLGKKIAELAESKHIKTVVFDRGFRKYHGLLAIIADAAREAGLKL
jgi:large subunit ribosomal protein L18